MALTITKTKLEKIKNFREAFLHEANMQFVCNKCHDYGWADTYLFTCDDEKIGYGSVWGTDRRQDRDTIFEFFITKPHRHLAAQIFPEFQKMAGTTFVECQSNDALLSNMLYMHCEHIEPEAILFEDTFQTSLSKQGAIFRRRMASDPTDGDDSEFVVVFRGQIVATGGLMLNYNAPYADIYMAVKEKYRQRGFGTFIVQELKKTAYRIGRVPAARCNVKNTASLYTLQKAGFQICGFRLKGTWRAAGTRA